MEASMELARDRSELVKKYKNNESVSISVIPEELNRESHLGSYSSFIGSPLHQGKYQFNLWNYSASLIDTIGYN